MRIDMPFRANYEIEVPQEFPSSGVGIVYFPPALPGQGGIYEVGLKFTYDRQKQWYGVFATRSKREGGLNLVSSMPHPDWCCVSSFGTGYVLNVGQPPKWHAIQLYPVLQERVVTEDGLLLLSSFTRMVAYGAGGQNWTTGTLCSDQLEIVSVSGGWIECTGWDAATDAKISFSLDVSSGQPRHFRTS
jgi:hypothetical protein